MKAIPDDPIISCMEQTGYPPWMDADWEDEEGEDEDDAENESMLD